VKGTAAGAWDEFNVGAANEVLQVNAGGTDLEWGLVDTANIAGGAVTPTKLDVDGFGDMLFTRDDGLLLLNSYCLLTPTAWTGTRGQVATISGAFHQEAGRWVDSRGLVVEPATTNYELAPRMRDANADGLADGWVYGDSFGSGGDATLTVVAHPIAERGWLQRMQYTGAAGDANHYGVVYDRTAAASFAAGENCTFSLDVRGSVSSCTAKIRVQAEDVANGNLGTQDSSLTLTDSIQRVQVTYTNLPANTDHVRVWVFVDGVDDGDTFDVYFGAVNVEKAAFATSPCIGSLDYCAWSGAEDDSTSTRTGTSIATPTAGSIEAAEGSITVWFKVDDWNASWGCLWSAGDVNGEFDALVSSAGQVGFRINGAYRCQSAVGAATEGVWHQAVFTWKVSTDVSELYLDGELVATGTCGGGAPTLHANLGVGYPSTVGVGNDLNGLVGEFATFNTVWTATEVAALYALHRPLVDAGALKCPVYDGRWVKLPVSTANVSSPPTEAELNLAFGDAGTHYEGFTALVDDNGAGTTVWKVFTTGGYWWYEELTQAT